MLKPVLVILIVLYAPWIAAQAPVYKNFTPADGLPSSETYHSIQDDKGYMWFGTDRGVVRYDGYSFKVYTTAEGLPDNTVFEFLKTSDGRVWFKTYSSELGYIEGDSIYRYQHNSKLRTSLPSITISGLMITGEGVTFVKPMHSETGEVDMIFKIDSLGSLDSLPVGNHPKYIYISKTGSLIYSGLNISGNSKLFWYETGEEIAEFAVNQPTRNVHISPMKKSRGFYLSSANKVFRYKDGVFEKVFGEKGEILSILSDDEDNLWVGYRLEGLVCYSISNGYKKKYSLLKKYSISSLYQDREKGIWVTTLENGIYYLPPLAPVSYSTDDGLPGASVKRIEKNGSNLLFVMTDNSVLLKKAGEAGFIPLSEKMATSVDIVASNDTIYYSGYPGFLLPLKSPSICMDVVKRIVVGEKYVYGVSGSTIETFSREGKSLSRYNTTLFPRFITVYESGEGLLVGTLRGVFLKTGDSLVSMEKYHPLYGSRIREIKQYDDRHIIFSTIGSGLFIVKDGDYGNPLHYTTAHGLPSMMCNVTLRVNDSLLWVGTNRGLCCIRNILDPDRAVFLTLDMNSGIASNEINDICLAGSMLWLATTRGVTLVPAFELPGKAPDIPVYIETVTVNGEKLSNLLASLSYRQNNITIFFTGLHFQHAGKLLYKYRLKGEEKWYYTSSRFVVYSSLQPGSYTFEVGVVKPDGSSNPLLARYTFTIRPPFWKTWWFITLIAFAAALGVYWFVSYRVRFVRNQEQLKTELGRFRDKALRDQMNPHFIYNSLNSIQNFILKNDTLESAAFLSKFSRLMRLVFNHTSQDAVTLEKDLEALTLYAELENLRFPDKFTLHIRHKLAAEASRVMVPPLLFQPFVENAILHGLLTKKSPGNIWLDIAKNDDRLDVTITDDGIGRLAAAEVNQRKARYFSGKDIFTKRKISGISATKERIEQVWKKKDGNSNFKVIDLHDGSNTPNGTTIQFCLPVKYD